MMYNRVELRYYIFRRMQAGAGECVKHRNRNENKKFYRKHVRSREMQRDRERERAVQDEQHGLNYLIIITVELMQHLH